MDIEEFTFGTNASFITSSININYTKDLLWHKLYPVFKHRLKIIDMPHYDLISRLTTDAPPSLPTVYMAIEHAYQVKEMDKFIEKAKEKLPTIIFPKNME
jgi:hypothetical protein